MFLPRSLSLRAKVLFWLGAVSLLVVVGSGLARQHLEGQLDALRHHIDVHANALQMIGQLQRKTQAEQQRLASPNRSVPSVLLDAEIALLTLSLPVDEQVHLEGVRRTLTRYLASLGVERTVPMAPSLRDPWATEPLSSETELDALVEGLDGLREGAELRYSGAVSAAAAARQGHQLALGAALLALTGLMVVAGSALLQGLRIAIAQRSAQAPTLRVEIAC